MAKPVAARLAGDRVLFDVPEYGVAPGQAAVLYAGDRVLGGGWIEETERALLAAKRTTSGVPLNGSGWQPSTGSNRAERLAISGTQAVTVFVAGSSESRIGSMPGSKSARQL